MAEGNSDNFRVSPEVSIRKIWSIYIFPVLGLFLFWEHIPGKFGVTQQTIKFGDYIRGNIYLEIAILVASSAIPATAISFAMASLQFSRTHKSRVLPSIISVLFYLLSITVLTYAIDYSIVGLKGANRAFDYVYFSVVTWTTLGYGDVSPVSELARILASSEALVGYIVMALIIAAVANAINNDKSGSFETDSYD